MTDRDLLELAAKAGRIKLQWDDRGVAWRKWPSFKWNPLEDDGDALRLANQVGICIEFGYCLDDAPIVRCGPIENRDNWPQVANFPDPYAATRRAIVKAAVAVQLAYEEARAG